MGLVRKMPQRPARKVAILVYEGMELLDFAGPAEVFAVTLGSDGAAFEVYTVGAGKEPVVSQQFLKITPQYSIADGPKPDIVVIPGGAYPALGRNERMMNWIKERARDIEILMSVCNGALVLARAGLLDGLEVTTHAGSIERLRGAVPGARVVTNRRFVDSGRIITAAGVSAGIDAALHVVERLLGPEAAANTARYMEYDLRPDRSFGAAGTAAPGKE
jgi:transcriptional regulator GlxA family with amidase domain